MEALNKDLFEWQEMRCTEHTHIEQDEICHDNKYPDVTYGEYVSCKGCPYER